MKHAAIFLATGAYSGYSPIAPGTAGSLVAALVLLSFDSFHGFWFWAAMLFLLVAGTWAAARAEMAWQKKDAQQIVIDEFLGMFISVAALPATWPALILAFVFFRLFDIFKPPPVRQAEKVESLLGGTAKPFSLASGFGVMLDDVVAGIYANLTLRLLLMLSII